jgi:hypothetical protein
MISDDVSPEVRQLIYLVTKTIIEKTKSNLKASIKFRQAYTEACKKDTKNKFDHSNLELRQHIRDILLRNDYIFVNPEDVEDVFITKKAIDHYELLSKDK